jgi:hypothetical protein
VGTLCFVDREECSLSSSPFLRPVSR